MRKRAVQKILKAFDRAVDKAKEKRGKAPVSFDEDELGIHSNLEELFGAERTYMNECLKATGDLIKALRKLVEPSYQ